MLETRRVRRVGALQNLLVLGVQRGSLPEVHRRRRDRASSAPVSRSRHHCVSCELHNPSRRSGTTIAPGSLAWSASASTERLYVALNYRRLATASISGSGLAPWSRACTTSATPTVASSDEITFSFFLCDMVRLPFESNFTKIGVSHYIDGIDGIQGILL